MMPVIVADPSNPSPAGRRTMRLPARALSLASVAAAALLGLGLAWAARDATWDDAAITLGYSRTLAETGAIQFGRYGERVEGFSTFLWMLVCAGLASVFRSPAALLGAAKVLCGGLYLLNGWLVYRLARRCCGSAWGPPALASACCGLAVSIVSVSDATENHLALTLHLLLGIIVSGLGKTPGRPAPTTLLGLGVLPFLAFLCRPEGSLTWAALAASLWLGRARLAAGRRGPIAVAVGGSLVLIGGFLLWRLSYFGALLPNTVYAKTWPPFFGSLATRSRSGALANGDFALAALGWLAPAAVAGPARLLELARALRDSCRKQAFFALTVLLFFFYHIGTGAPRGTVNRIWIAAAPFAMILFWTALERLSWSGEGSRVVASVVLFAAIQMHDYQRYCASRITVAGVKELLEPAARLLALSTGDPPRRLATPDTGATILCWGQELQVIDLALLNNRVAAHGGWSVASATVFERGAPDLIETHEPWTALNGLDAHPRVLREYQRVSVDGRFYLARRELLDRIRARPPAGLSIRPAADLAPEERSRLRARVFTDFRAGSASVPLPWVWVIELPPPATAG